MTELILGLILFLGAHSVRIVADDWRTQKMEALGEKAFKGVHALISLLGLYAPAKPNLLATLITLFGGMALWAVITFVLHAKVVGVAPLA